VNTGSGTAPPYRRDGHRRLAFWLALIGSFIVLQYVGRSEGAVAEKDALYHWTFAVSSVIQEAVFLAFVLAISGLSRELLGLRGPRSKRAALKMIGLAFVGIQVFQYLYTAVVQPGNEQGLTPDHWESAHAIAYVVNGVVICTVVPFVEEVTFRGLGYSLLAPFGHWPAIAVTGILFGLSHGLVLELPIIIVFGWFLAWIRYRTESVFPGMVLHGTFNLIALVAAVTIAN
jgi:membrane protease YdiL (CAAX protease family)